VQIGLPERMDDSAPVSVLRTLRLKVRSEGYAWLNAAAVEANQVFNYCNETSLKAATRTDRKRKLLSGFDLCSLTAGASPYFEKIGADTIQSICNHYAQKRQAARRLKLRWRVSRGSRRSLGWVPFKAASLKRKGVCLRFAGKSFRVFERATPGRDPMAGRLLCAGCRGGLVAVSAGQKAGRTHDRTRGGGRH
jgi:hypothetical protein